MKDPDHVTVEEALRIIRLRGLGKVRGPGYGTEKVCQKVVADIVAEVVTAAAVLYKCEGKDVISRDRGHKDAARARVVAMHACVALGLPMQVTARAFRRSRRSVHAALRLGRAGRESRDEAILQGFRSVVRTVKLSKLAYLSEKPEP